MIYIFQFICTRNQPHQQLMTQPTLSTASAGSSSSQHQNPAMASPSPLSQYTPNGERQTTPPHHLSASSQLQGLSLFFSCVSIAKLSHTKCSDIYTQIAFPFHHSPESNEQGQTAITSYACTSNNDNNNNSNADRAIGSCSSSSGNGSSGNSVSHIREHSPNIAINNISRLVRIFQTNLFIIGFLTNNFMNVEYLLLRIDYLIFLSFFF